MSEEKVPTLIELVKQFREGTLSDDKVFKYQSVSGVHLIHRDELEKEAVMSSIYSGVHKDKIIGTRTRQ